VHQVLVLPQCGYKFWVAWPFLPPLSPWFAHQSRDLPFWKQLWKQLWNMGVSGDPGLYTPDFELPSDGNFLWEFRGQDGSYASMRWQR
jgi:hypothetical protein